MSCSEDLHISWCALQRMNPDSIGLGHYKIELLIMSETISCITTGFGAHNHGIQRRNTNDFAHYPVRYKTQLLACLL